MKSATLLRNTRPRSRIYNRRASPLPRGSAKPSHEQILDHLDAVVAGQRTGSGQGGEALAWCLAGQDVPLRSEEHTSELQSLMRISYAVFCLKKKTIRPSLQSIKPPILTKLL